MQATSFQDLIEWHVALEKLSHTRACVAPAFLRPFHFVMLALEAKRRRVRQLTLPDNLRDYAARMQLWEAAGMDPPCEVGRRDPAGTFLPVQPLHDSETVADTAEKLAEIAKRNADADDQTIESLSTVLIELLNNCFDHAAVHDHLRGLACAQSWRAGHRSSDRVAHRSAARHRRRL